MVRQARTRSADSTESRVTYTDRTSHTAPSDHRVVITERRDMTHEGRFQQLLGMMVSLIAILIASAVVVYFYYVFWLVRAPDYQLSIGAQVIPPETYPYILLTAFVLSQRAMSIWRPQTGTLGEVFWWIDLITSFFVAAFLGFTFFKAVVTGSNLTFLIVLGAFLIQAIGDILLNGRTKYGVGEASVPGTTLHLGDIQDGVMVVKTYRGKFAKVVYEDVESA